MKDDFPIQFARDYFAAKAMQANVEMLSTVIYRNGIREVVA